MRDILERMPRATQNLSPLKIKEPDCPGCNDLRMVHPLKEDGKPDLSRVVPCRRCMDNETIQRHLGISSIKATFDNFILRTGSESAYKSAKLLAELRTTWKLLLIYGSWGNGKTHLIEAIALALWGRGSSASVRNFPSFIERLKSTFDRVKAPGDNTFIDIMGGICSTPYLLLDDVGAAGSFTPFALAQLERIILARYRDNAFTVITTNLDQSEIPPFIISRFSDTEKGRMVLNTSTDYRPLKRGVKG